MKFALPEPCLDGHKSFSESHCLQKDTPPCVSFSNPSCLSPQNKSFITRCCFAIPMGLVQAAVQPACPALSCLLEASLCLSQSHLVQSAVDALSPRRPLCLENEGLLLSKFVFWGRKKEKFFFKAIAIPAVTEVHLCTGHFKLSPVSFSRL